MNTAANKISCAMLVAAMFSLAATSWPAAAGTTDLADVPLANATTTTILPNIMLDVDNSGSMGLDHMPDYVSKNYTGTNAWCRGTDTGNTLKVCEQGDPPYFASTFNGVYYNPAVRYDPPVNSDGTPKTSYGSPWTTVASDGYGVQRVDKSASADSCTAQGYTWGAGDACPTYATNATVDLTTSYPERVWCKNSSDTPPSANCKSAIETSNTYIYPNGTYKWLKVQTGAPYYYTVSVQWCSNKNATGADKNYGKENTCQSKKTSSYQYVRFYNWSRVDIKSTSTFPAKAAARTDCAGSTCTYTEEMTNFANWFAWYRTRMQMTKSSIGLAFKDVRGTPKTGLALTADPADPDYFHARIGFTTINTPVALNIANFDTSQKSSFYTSLYALAPSGLTPLRTSLNSIGKMYQGTSSTYTDPVQYSCQRNFVILTTDGYWNDSYSGVGDVDGAATCGTTSEPTRPSCDKLKTANTLADVAYYYYHTDLRPGSTDNVPSAGSNPNSPVDDVAQHQHMTTFTVGLGVDGTLTYQDGYKTSTSGDYYNITQGTQNWPSPSSNVQETIDDLWHAAVNGRGTYFSARDPGALQDGLQKALGNMASTTGSGAAAATSNLQPTSGDNYIYIATYRTLQWDGEMSAYTIDLGSGAINSSAAWQASTLLKAKIAASGDSDTRTIYVSEGTLKQFTWANLSAGEQAYFDNTKLNQYADWSDTQKTTATGSLLVNYLRGQDRHEDQDRDASYGSYQRLYRDRDKIMGDIIHTQPIYVKTPPHNFADAGYSDFKAANASRSASLYAAANDGMLHAFNAADGTERWAYVPTMTLPNLWRLADRNYGNNHRFYLDGPMIATDAYIGGGWKTILIGAMGKGGRGYYALDITDPSAPLKMWEFSADSNNNVGYSYGTPFVTKLGDGTWVAVVTSGYNNVPEGSNYSSADGKGYLFVLNLADGTVLKKFPTGVGTTGNPSGLAKINVRMVKFDVDNTAIGAYGGDLYGNMWRFNLDAADGTAPTKLAALGAAHPIMVAPEIADINGKTAVFFGTGRYLGQTDLSDTTTQTIYGIKDDGTTTITGTAQLVQQTTSGTGSTRTLSKNSVDWTTQYGWYLNLPDSGERVTIDPQLYFGTLSIATTVPSATECQPGGYSWLYQLDYLTGGYVGNVATVAAGTRFTSPIVGLTVAKLQTGTPIFYPITADGKLPDPTTLSIASGGGAVGTKRVLWREIVN